MWRAWAADAVLGVLRALVSLPVLGPIRRADRTRLRTLLELMRSDGPRGRAAVRRISLQPEPAWTITPGPETPPLRCARPAAPVADDGRASHPSHIRRA